ncbi:EamA family transporter [Faecalibacter rhinopitheci]|uniref:EamA family transporter n=1 Tax=Faecalibacter rhinopitheci TaxID=2779678 RepID=A0A8J7K353_9FLAO|nr:EamA family transporter [Faecalibacter rhinopitheci]MBF0596153.1 EamA family transporter [Faecalibacter rhinopitheci]
MQNNQLLKGVLFVGLGSSFYGMLATFVKLAYDEGYSTAEVTASQFVLGILILITINAYLFFKGKDQVKFQGNDRIKLLVAGSSIGLTSLFYYIAVQYINVSIAIVLLMQTVWISILVESILQKSFPSLKKILAVIIVLVGTLMATNLIGQKIDLDWRGIFWGLIAACSFTTTMFTANRLANYLPTYKKSLYMILGGGFMVLMFVLISQIGPYYFSDYVNFNSFLSDEMIANRPFNISIFFKWGIALSLFGTVLPPILMNKGFPMTGLGLGSIVASVELPVSVTMAFVLLQEKVLLVQWLGIIIILFAIVFMNYSQVFPKKNKI